MQKKQKMLIIGSSILLIYLVFSTSFFSLFFDKDFYDESYTKYGVYDELGVQGVRSLTDNLIKYLTSESTKIEVLGSGLFFPDELDHLKDVKRIIIFVKWSSIAAAIVLCLIFLFKRRQPETRALARKSLLIAGIASLTIVLALLLLSLNFEPFFLKFHEIFFPQGNYLFPNSYLLIRLFPGNFFESFTAKMFTRALILGLVVLSLAMALPKDKAGGYDMRHPQGFRKVRASRAKRK